MQYIQILLGISLRLARGHHSLYSSLHSSIELKLGLLKSINIRVSCFKPLWALVSSTAVPTVTVSQMFYNQTIGRNTFLKCSVTATPNATNVFWQKYTNNRYRNVTVDGLRFNGANLNFPSLLIVNSQISDTGSYRCGATNNAGTSYSNHVFLNVTGSEHYHSNPNISFTKA